jgi:hypothetical protein
MHILMFILYDYFHTLSVKVEVKVKVYILVDLIKSN